MEQFSQIDYITILRYLCRCINTAEAISGIPSSWPGYNLENGSGDSKVRQLQEQINVIAGAYPAIPKLAADGIYGPVTAAPADRSAKRRHL